MQLIVWVVRVRRHLLKAWQNFWKARYLWYAEKIFWFIRDTSPSRNSDMPSTNDALMSSSKQIVDSSKTLQACSCLFVARVVPTLSCPFCPSWVFCINRNATKWLVLLIMSADFCRMIQHCLLMLLMLAAPHTLVFLLIVFISDTRKPYSRQITLLS